MVIEVPSEDEFDTLDILKDIYGDRQSQDFSFDFVNQGFPGSNYSESGHENKDSSSQTFTHSTSYTKPLQFYPLTLFSSFGYSCLGLLELSKAFDTRGIDSFNLKNTKYYQMCLKDQEKLFRPSTHLELGESFAVKSSCYEAVNPPLYLKRYSKSSEERDDYGTNSLLSEPIEDLFKKIWDVDLDQQKVKSEQGERLFKRRRKTNKPGVKSQSKRESWVTKYKPEYFSDLLTNENTNLECLKWMASWKCASNYLPKYTEPENKILMIGGPAGVGKSCLVNVLARHCGYNVVEINSSDDRTKGRVIPIINGVVSAGSVNPKKPNLCLLEDIDTLAGSELAIISHLRQINGKKSSTGNFIKRPIVCTCTDVYARQLKELREVSKVVIIESCDPALVQSRLDAVLEEEGLFVPDEFLKEVQETYKYDIRSCLTVLEFLTNYSGRNLSLTLADLTKDSNEGINKLLQTVFSTPKPSLQDIEKYLMVTINSLGYNYTSSVISENATSIPMKGQNHLLKLSIVQDIIAQSDVVCNRFGSPIQTIQLLKVCCGFVSHFMSNNTSGKTKYLYPQKTNFHTYNMKCNKAKNIIHALQKSSYPLVSQTILSRDFTAELLPFILRFLLRANKTLHTQSLPFILRVIKGLEGCWEGLFPHGSTKFPKTIYPLLHMAQIIALYGIAIVNVNQVTVFDPPVFELTLKVEGQDQFQHIPERFSQMLINFVEFYRTGNKSYFTDDTHFKGSSFYKSQQFGNLFEAIKFIYNEGFEKFKRLNLGMEREDPSQFDQVLCKRTHSEVAPVLFSQIVLNDCEILRAFLRNKKRITEGTTGNFKYQDQNCSAVRYIINQL